jgi:hypothetical protein
MEDIEHCKVIECNCKGLEVLLGYRITSKVSLKKLVHKGNPMVYEHNDYRILVYMDIKYWRKLLVLMQNVNPGLLLEHGIIRLADYLQMYD